MKYKVAILGRGLVSQKLCSYLNKDRDIDEIDIYCSNPTNSENEKYRHLKYEDLNSHTYDVVFGMTDSETTKRWFNYINASLFIDNSECFRLNPSVPLIVSKTNDMNLNLNTKIVSNPNCIVAMVSKVLIPLNYRYPIDKIHITTYQSISGLGQKGLDNYHKERDDDIYLEGSIVPRFTFKGQNVNLYNNIVPLVGEENSVGYTLEEEKIDLELKKLLGQNVETAIMCARVPVEYCHSAYVHITFKDRIDHMRIKAFIENIPTVTHLPFVTSSMAKDSDMVYVSRIKKDHYCPFAMMLFIASDNLTIGSALNSYEIFLKYKR